MNSQLATVLTNGILDDKNGRQCVAGLRAVPEVSVDLKEDTLAHQPSVEELNSSNDGQSFKEETADVDETSKPSSQEMGELPGPKQPIKIKTGVPVLRKQPIKIKIVVPPRCKRPMTNSAISLTKDTYHSEFTGLTPASNCNPPSGTTTENNTETLPVALLTSTVMTEQETEEALGDGCEIPKVESFQRTETAEEKEDTHKEDVTSDAKVNESITYPIIPEMPLISSTNSAPLQGPEGTVEETSGGDSGNNVPLDLHTMEWKSSGCGEVDQVVMEEQTEALDLSLPKKRDSRDRRYGRFLDDPGCESSLIMEVDEFEGDGDRDIVEEDDVDYGEDSRFHVDVEAPPLLSPSFFSNSVLTSLSPVDCDTENLLLIDDQGIPYTLSPDGQKVPQIDSSSKSVDALSTNHRMDKPDLRNMQGGKSSRQASLAGCHVSQSLEDLPEMQSTCSGDMNLSPASTAGLPPSGGEFSIAGQDMESEEPSKTTEPAGKTVHQAGDVNAKAPGTSAPSQPIQILTNTSANTTTNTPILLLASSSSTSSGSSTAQLASAPLGLSLPLTVTQSSPGASTPMLLLLSSVPSAPGQPAAPSTPIAILDPSTGQLSQITGSTASVSLPLSSGQAATLGSSLSSTLSHPIIRLSPNNPPVILSGVGGNMNPAPILTSLAVAPTTSALQTSALIASGGAVLSTTHLLHTRQNASNPSPDREAIATHEAPEENTKPSTFSAVSSSSPGSQSAGTTVNASDQPASEAADQSPTFEPKSDAPDPRSEIPPLEDHLYFSSTTAPPSPPMGPILTSGNFDTLDPMGPLSPASSPNSLGPRRVLYCHLCPRVFFYLSDLERHAITHSQKKPHVCQQCGKAFKRSSHLQRHKHIHTGQRNYVCPICAKRFREAGELQRHQRVHTGEKPYQCQLCHTRFAERNTLRRHTKRKHPYHQVAMEMLSERRGGGGEGGGGGGVGGVPEEEESAEWYNSTVSNLNNSESDTEA